MLEPFAAAGLIPDSELISQAQKFCGTRLKLLAGTPASLWALGTIALGGLFLNFSENSPLHNQPGYAWGTATAFGLITGTAINIVMLGALANKGKAHLENRIMELRRERGSA
jgi:hypothetical protein